MSGIINSAGSKSGVIGETEIDYEVGKVTAPLKLGSTNQTNFYNCDSCYTKIGNIVTYNIRFDTYGQGLAASGALYINLPFVFKGTANNSGDSPRVYFPIMFSHKDGNTGDPGTKQIGYLETYYALDYLNVRNSSFDFISYSDTAERLWMSSSITYATN